MQRSSAALAAGSAHTPSAKRAKRAGLERGESLEDVKRLDDLISPACAIAIAVAIAFAMSTSPSCSRLAVVFDSTVRAVAVVDLDVMASDGNQRSPGLGSRPA
jgi:hypothetical protein